MDKSDAKPFCGEVVKPLDLVERAIAFATKAHRGQFYGNEPYLAHLCYLDDVLEYFGIEDPWIKAACWLHGVLDEMVATAEELRREFPEGVVEIVEWVTGRAWWWRDDIEDSDEILGKVAGSGRALTVKLADRIANTAYSLEHGDEKMAAMYRREYPAFRAALYTKEAEFEGLWAALDDMQRVES